MVVTFLGHHDAPALVRAPLERTLLDLIECEGADKFYIGNNGSFDRIAISVLQKLKTIYPHIHYHVVLAYLPHQAKNADNTFDTLFPAEVATAPARFAIDRRNDWMLQQSDVVITYVVHSFGGAAKFKKKALAAKKRIVELSAQNPPLFF